MGMTASLLSWRAWAEPPDAASSPPPFHSTAFGREEYTNSIVASRNTNISPREVYDSIASPFVRHALEATAAHTGRGTGNARALDLGSGAGVSTQVLYNMGYHTIDAVDWSRDAWETFVDVCPPLVHFHAQDDETFFRSQTTAEPYNVIVYNFAVNESKARWVAQHWLEPTAGRLLAPVNLQTDYWEKQRLVVFNPQGEILWSQEEVGAWSVQFQPDVTQDSCSGIWCAPYNGFQRSAP